MLDVILVISLSNLDVDGTIAVGVTTVPLLQELSVLSKVTDVPVMIFQKLCQAPFIDRVTFTCVTQAGNVQETLAYFEPPEAVVETVRGVVP